MKTLISDGPLGYAEGPFNSDARKQFDSADIQSLESGETVFHGDTAYYLEEDEDGITG